MSGLPPSADLACQERMLQGVSRTFALTIPQLPAPLAQAVGNAYLLCRIADTIEDEPALDARQKRELSELFNAVLAQEETPQRFMASLHPLLSRHTTEDERELIRNTVRVVRITHSFSPRQRGALLRCVRIMSRGMAEFQEGSTLSGLPRMRDLDRYCYHVAGVVGEMLTELFCEHVPAIDPQRAKLLELAVSFGQGLQMTNILKDIWEDRARGACWLPRDVFQRAGFDLDDLAPDARSPAFEEGLSELIGIARQHLARALAYTLMMPGRETGIRRFCLRALGMAVLTLRRIHGRLDFRAGDEVKISRASVGATVVVTDLTARRDPLLKGLFAFFTRPLPPAPDPLARG